ncbi:hypothetical protein HYPSUDRAFT_45649 [Hypholoma sublateritium FD-334 SS-4]|uniref:Secreted protein n=1 Tax=Hypholoma sublateritium (strain FD-334 SS-4) TaxID=945553 RepID=A0A0D2M4G6_HYPSF|nr:hypothetical protein HYPSUDRAFT_45649 [Hypholoma sublateritium FD-334 SS-4]
MTPSCALLQLHACCYLVVTGFFKQDFAESWSRPRVGRPALLRLGFTSPSRSVNTRSYSVHNYLIPTEIRYLVLASSLSITI